MRMTKKKNFLLSNRAGAARPAAALVGVFVLLSFFWVIFVSFTNRTLLGQDRAQPGFRRAAELFPAVRPGDLLHARGQFGFSLDPHHRSSCCSRR